MKIYVAASSKALAQIFADVCERLEGQGHDVQPMNVTPRYIEKHATCCSRRAGIAEMQALQQADIVAIFAEAALTDSGDTFVEFGVALGMDKPVCLIGPRSNVFACLPSIRHFKDAEEFLEFTSVAKFNFGAIQMPPSDPEGPEV